MGVIFEMFIFACSHLTLWVRTDIVTQLKRHPERNSQFMKTEMFVPFPKKIG
jgi:hypothetical protein